MEINLNQCKLGQRFLLNNRNEARLLGANPNPPTSNKIYTHILYIPLTGKEITVTSEGFYYYWSKESPYSILHVLEYENPLDLEWWTEYQLKNWR